LIDAFDFREPVLPSEDVRVLLIGNLGKLKAILVCPEFEFAPNELEV